VTVVARGEGSHAPRRLRRRLIHGDQCDPVTTYYRWLAVLATARMALWSG
jgi:hypothetical protein